MKKTLILFALFLSINYLVHGQVNTSEKIIASDVLLEDYDFMLRTLEETHPNLYAYIPKKEFIEKTNKLRKSLKKPLEKKEFQKIILKTIALIHQGHTMMFGDAGFKKFLKNGGYSFPFTIKYFTGNIYIDENFSSNEKLIKGTELIAINDVPISKIISDLIPYLRVRPHGFIGSTLSYNWARLLWLHYNFNEDFKISYILPNENKIQTLVVKGIHKDPKPTKQHSEKFSLNIDLEKSVAEMVINTFHLGFDEYNSFLKESFSKLKKNGIENLIIDIRNNGGGNSNFIGNLMDYLTDKPYMSTSKLEVKSSKATKICYTTHPIFLSAVEEARKAEDDSSELKDILECLIEKEPGTITKFENKNSIPSKEKENRFMGNLYVLTSHNTFSAATTFSGTIKDNQLGYIVGEETSDGPSSYSCIMLFELPNTKINIQNSTLYKVRAAKYDDGRGVIPDFIVNTSYSDHIKGNDKIMRYTYWLIENKIKK